MEIEELKSLVQNIVAEATKLKNIHTNESNVPVNYACVFCHSSGEYDELISVTDKIGKVVKTAPNGLLFHIQDLDTVSGKLKLLKIRMPDITRLERGDADFTVSDYPAFKKENINKPGFKLIDRGYMEMIELMDSAFDVRVYFSNPPLDVQFGLVKYTVYVDDNFHYQDENYRHEYGQFDSYEEAVTVCKKIVEQDFDEFVKNAITPKDIYSYYTSHGSDPWISPVPKDATPFSAWDYAKGLTDKIISNS